jgi:hypothetical protein
MSLIRFMEPEMLTLHVTENLERDVTWRRKHTSHKEKISLLYVFQDNKFFVKNVKDFSKILIYGGLLNVAIVPKPRSYLLNGLGHELEFKYFDKNV